MNSFLKNRTGLTLAAVTLASITARADYDPVPLTAGTFTQDVVVENTAPAPLGCVTTATVDEGTNNTAWTWYERGYNTNAAYTQSGLPPAGSTWASMQNPSQTFKMAPSYQGNCGVLLDNFITAATVSLVTPAVYTNLAFVSSGGNGGQILGVTAIHQDGSNSWLGTFASPDWFNSPGPALVSTGRVSIAGFGLHTPADNPRLYSRELAVLHSSPIVSLLLTNTTRQNRAHVGVLAVSGAQPSVGTWAPIDITGYNVDLVVEATAPRPGVFTTPVVTATMDGGIGTNNWTWMEQGYVSCFPTRGLPPAGSTITSLAYPDRHYTMPPSYSAKNALWLDASANSLGNLTPATPAAFTAISLLGSSVYGSYELVATVQHLDGSSQAETLTVIDWHDSQSSTWNCAGRVNTANREIGELGTQNPRLHEYSIVLNNNTSPITNVNLGYSSSGESTRAVFFGMSGTTGAVKPIIVTDPASQKTYVGAPSVTFSVTAIGTAPLSYQWQVGTNGVFVNLADGGDVSGANSDTLTLANIVIANEADYRVNVSNGGGSTTSGSARLSVLNTSLFDVTAPTDPVTGFPVNWPGGEPPANSINDSTTKYLNFDGDTAVSGFTVTPAAGRTIVTALRFYTADDDARRDPASYLLEGSNDGGSSYTIISSNALALPSGRNDGGLPLDPLNQNVQEVRFANAAGFTSYRLSFPTIKDAAAGMMQIGEIEFLGVQDLSGIPTVTLQPPTNPKVLEDHPFLSLSATATGDPYPTLQWYKKTGSSYVPLVDNGSHISGAQTLFLSILDVVLGDGGDYILVANNSSGYATSGVATVTVISTRNDVTLPSDVISSFGDHSVGRGGITNAANAINNNLGVYLNGGSGFNAPAGFPPFAGPVGLNLAPRGLSVLTGIRIYASDAGIASDPADYRLEGSPDGTNYTVLSAGLLNIPIERNATGDGLDPLTNSVQEILFANSTAFKTYRLTITNVKDNANADSMQIGELELLGTISGPAVLAVQPASTNILEGTPAQFVATVANTTPDTSYRWQKLVGNSYVPVADAGDISGSGTSTLSFSGAAMGDAGTYRLTISNSLDVAVSVSVVLNVFSSLPDVTAPGDPIVVYNGATPGAEGVEHAIDNDTAKYLNFGIGDAAPPYEGPTGLIVTPAAGQSIVKYLRVYAANDATERDPSAFTLEGSNDGGGSFQLIAGGDITLPGTRNPGAGTGIAPLTQVVQEIPIANNQPFSTYRLIFTSVKDATAANAMQVAEVELLGTTVALPVLTFGVSGSDLTITTTINGTLHSATNLNAGTFWTNEGPINGSIVIPIDPGTPQKFFRVSVP